jgi:uncharacterized protein with HEPN domain
MIRFASIKQVEIIGEATKNLTEETKNKYSNIEWIQITGLRDIFSARIFWYRC